MSYGHMINGQLIVVKTIGAEDKPIRYTEAPEVEIHHRAVCSYREDTDEIVQVWEIIETTDEPPEDLDDTKALSIMLGEEQ